MPLAPVHPTERTPSDSALAVARESQHPIREDNAETGPGITPAQVLHALRRRWLIAFPLAAVMATIVYLTAESQVAPVYTARTLIHVGAGKPVILYDNLSERVDPASHQRTQIATVKSRPVRQAAVKELEPLDLVTLRTKSDPVGWMEKEIQADFTTAPEILRLTMKGNSPDELLVILNTLRDVYLREIANRDRTERLSRVNNLKEFAAKHEEELKTKRQKLTARAEGLGARDLPGLRSKSDTLNQRLYSLQSELLLARLELQRLETAPGALAPKEDANVDPLAVEAALEKALAADPVADALRKDIEQLEKKLADYELRLRNYEDEPDYKQAKAKLVTSRMLLNRRREDLRVSVTEQLRRAAGNQKPGVVLGPERTAFGAKQQIALLEAEIQRKERELPELTKAIGELEILRGEIATNEEQLNLANSKIRALEVELQAPARAGSIEDAVIVETPRWQQSMKYTLAPAGVTFLAVVCLIAWLDLRRGRVNGSADLEAARVRVIGAVPSVKANVLPSFAMPTHNVACREYLEFTDAIDMTRAVIAPILASVRGYTLAVTSAGAGEGKTMVSAHLAAQLARSGLRTLLIDTDVRRPKVDQLFGLKPGAGFGELMCGEVELSEVVTQGSVDGLDIITAGGCDARTVAELLELRFPELLRAAKETYDVVVLDTAPLLSTPETLALTRLADGVVLSVMRDVSRLPDVRTCTDRLASINAHVLGAVVTGDSPARYGSY